MSDLCGRSRTGSTPIHIESSVFLAQIVERLTVGGPNRLAVFTTKRCQLPISRLFTRSIHPYIASNRRNLMLTPIILIPLFILIEHCSFLIDRDAFHWHRWIKDRTPTLYRNFIHLPELSIGRKKDRFGRRHYVCGEQDMSGITKGHRRLTSRMGSQSARLASFFGNNVNIHASHTVGSKSNPLAVRTPHRLRIMGGIGGELHGTPTVNRNRIDIAFISKSNRSSVGRNGTMTQPKRSILCRSKSRQTDCGQRE